MVKQTEVVAETPFYIGAERSEFINVALVGLGSGLLTITLGALISRFFMEPVFCQSPDSFSVCANGGAIAFNVAALIVAAGATAVLAQLNVFRPLLITVFTVFSLWSLNALIASLAWWEYALWAGLLFALSFVLFFWLMRTRSFLWSLGLSVAAIIVIRLLLSL